MPTTVTVKFSGRKFADRVEHWNCVEHRQFVCVCVCCSSSNEKKFQQLGRSRNRCACDPDKFDYYESSSNKMVELSFREREGLEQ